MDQPAIVSDQVSQKYQSYNNSANQYGDTLDEPVIDTIKRDASQIYQKIKATLVGGSNYEKVKQNWDLWGPLVISLVTASMGALGAGKNAEHAFTVLFIGLWLGPLIITVNANLLGGKFGIMQTLCLIIYCSSPIMVLAMCVSIMNLISSHLFFINLILAGGALYFILKTNRGFFQSFIEGQKQKLTLYPVLLFYTFMCIFIAMT